MIDGRAVSDEDFDKAWNEQPPEPELTPDGQELLAEDGGEDHPGDTPEEGQDAPQGEQTGQEAPAPQPNLVEALRAMEARQKESSDEVRSLSEQLRQVNAEAAIARQLPRTENGPTEAQIAKAQQDPESWAKFKEDWPEWGGPITDFVNATIQAAGTRDEASLRERIKAEVQAELKAAREADIVAQKEQERQQAEAAREHQKLYSAALPTILEAHKDFESVKVSPEFTAWRSQQSEATQALAYSYDARDAITMMNLFKASRPPERTADTVQAARQLRVRQATVPNKTISQTPVKAVDTSRMSFDDYWEYDTKLKEAQARRNAQSRA